MLRKIILGIIAASCTLAPKIFGQEPPADYADLPVMDYSNQQEYIIGGVTVTGVKFIDANVLASMSGLETGQKIIVPGDDVTKVMDKFWEQGLFSYVNVIAKKIEGNVIFFEIVLRERSRLSKITIEGVRKGEVKDLTEKINVKAGSQLTENVLNNIKTIITKHYRDKGYYNVSVDFVQKQDTAITNRAALRVIIDKHSKVKIAEIDFMDNSVFKDRRLRRVMKKTKQLKWNLNIFKSKKYVIANLKEDRSNLAEFYNKNGYRDFKILNDSITFVNDKRVVLHVRISEGGKYYFRNITWVGNTKYPTEYLQRLLGYNKGDIYDQVGLNKRLLFDEDAVSATYQNNGYLFSSITPVELHVENDSVDVEMRVFEGEQATIDRVVIKGNYKTNEHVARRELRVHPGDLYSKDLIIRDIRELANLGHFDPEKLGTDIDIQPKPQNGTVDVVYNLTEKANDQLELSAGFGGGMFIGRVGVRFNNFAAGRIFDLKSWRPVPSGDGQTLGLSVQSNGKYYQSYNITFIEPWLGGKKRNSFSISLYHSKITNQSYYWSTEGASQYYKTSGVTIGLGKMLKWPDDWFSLSTELTYMRYKVQDWPRSGGYYSLPFSNGTSNNFNLGITLGRNSQDQTIYPRRGSNVSLSLHITPPWSAFNDVNYKSAKVSEKYKWIEYHKWIFKAAWYLNVVDKMVLATNYQFGYLGYFNKDVSYSPYEGFDMGGSGMGQYQIHGIEIVPMRGYTDGALTPRVDEYYSKANIYTKANMELRYPVIMQPSSTIYLVGFAEVGNAWYEFKDYHPFNLKRTAGIGVRAFLPMFGLLGIDWGYGFDAVPGGGKKGEFQFIMGQQF
ncbi:MAG: outer membrane protein assembly factor BamA [Bacteroidales bacterium]|jgi:outer membrane protein insertion porin family|nr:outer membrane protein assembly factor BamA [Bacteroidales bacterium]